MGFFKTRKKAKEPVLVARIQNTVSSEIYQEMLKENNVPFICRQEGSGGYLKHITGGLFVVDSIYVMEEYLNLAKELYEAYISENHPDDFHCEED